MNQRFIVLSVVASAVFQMCVSVGAASERVEPGLLAKYDFTEGEGDTVSDCSGIGEPLNLKLDQSSGLRWAKGGLRIESPALIKSIQPAKKIIDAVTKSNSITVEVWVKPANNSQGGPARIVSLSADTSQRNFTLGQEEDFYDFRLRATGSDNNGIPSTSAPKGSSQGRLTHVVFTRDSEGSAIVYVDGKQVASKKVSGAFSNWDDGYHLMLGNEATGDRPWLGEIQLVAVYGQSGVGIG